VTRARRVSWLRQRRASSPDAPAHTTTSTATGAALERRFDGWRDESRLALPVVAVAVYVSSVWPEAVGGAPHAAARSERGEGGWT